MEDPHNNNWQAYKLPDYLAKEQKEQAAIEEDKFFKRHSIGDDDLKYYNAIQLSDRASDRRWMAIDKRVTECRVKDIRSVGIYESGPAGRSDTIGEGVQGIVNPVDGKRYDSKSAYYRKLKESGHHVYEGNGNPNKVLDRGDHHVFKELKEAAMRHGL